MDNKDKETIKPCPFSGMICPCGCGQKYGGMCLLPQPCICCINGMKHIKSFQDTRIQGNK